MVNPKILVLDDDSTVHEAVGYALRKYELEIVFATSIDQAIEHLAVQPESFVLGFIDHRLQHKDGSVELGLGIVPYLRRFNKNMSPVMISGSEEESVLKSWLDQKINRYLYKPLKIDLVRAIYDVEFERWRSTQTSSSDDDKQNFEVLKKFKMISRSKRLLAAINVAMKAAQSNSSLVTLILGESGTGKELVAKGIHDQSSRASQPFLPINCASFGGSDALLESELFGHEKGSFTGADKRKIGIFEAATGGTVFLDEVHCLSKNSQEKLLRVIQERKIRRVGSNVEYPLDVRLIAAGKPNLFELATAKEFLPDLYYRLNGFDIELPSLRERRGDILLLMNYFLKKKNGSFGKKIFDESVIETLTYHLWPGNVRELETAVERAYEVSDGDIIKLKDLPQSITLLEEADPSLGIIPVDQLKDEYNEKVKKSIVAAIIKTGNNLSFVSRLLKTDRADIRYKIKALGIDKMSAEEKQKLIET